MPLDDLIKSHFTDSERATALDLIQQLRQLLQAKLQALSPEDRQRYGSIGEENKKFVNKVYDLIEEDSRDLPENFDLAEFLADGKDRRLLGAAMSELDSLLFEIRSTKILHDWDNYQLALAYYRYQQFRMSVNGPRAEGRVSQLSPFFEKAKAELEAAEAKKAEEEKKTE